MITSGVQKTVIPVTVTTIATVKQEEIERLSDELFQARQEIEKLKGDLEVERMRLAACGVAALGYFEGCADEYYSGSLDDVLRLREKYTAVSDHRKMSQPYDYEVKVDEKDMHDPR